MINKLTILFLVLYLGTPPAYADQRLDQKLTQSIQSAKKSSLKKKKAQKELISVKKELLKATKSLHKTEHVLNTIDRDIKAIQDKQIILAKRLYQEKGAESSLIYAVYQMQKTPRAGSYFSNQNKQDVINRRILLNAIIPDLNTHIRSWEQELEDLHNTQKQLVALKHQKEEENSRLKSDNKTLNRLVQKRQKLYQTVSTVHQSHIDEVSRLKEKAQNLNELVTKLKPALKPTHLKKQNAVFTTTPPSNEKTLPVVGRIKVAYGQKDEIGGKNNGIIFATGPHATAVSPMAGAVVFAGPFQHFKKLLIIEHQGGYHSLIAGLDKIQTELGANLEAGEPIGQIIHDNQASGRLYYELRHNGKPINPEKVLQIK